MHQTEVDGSTFQALQAENKRLRRAVEELSILNELARDIGASSRADELMQKIISRSLRAVHAEQGTITLIEPQADHPMKTLVRSMVSSKRRAPFHLEHCILGWMHLNKRPLRIDNPQSDVRFQGVHWEETVHSLLCVPLLVKSELVGVLTVCNKKDEVCFNDDDLRLLTIIAGQSAQVLENARLYEEEKLLVRMQEEMRLASEIQTALLPKSNPQLAGYDIAGISIPAQVVGGDYFDFILIDDHRLAICLGDVSGKGIAAALLMANLQATIRGRVAVNPSPTDCLNHANRLLYRSTDPHRFATLVYAVLDSRSHQLDYANAGHNRPLLFRPGQEAKVMETAGIALSFVLNYHFSQDTVILQPDDLLLIYSDGVSEAMNLKDEEFGEDRLTEFVGQNLTATAADLIERIIAEVKRYATGRLQMDDMTLVIVKRQGE